MADRKAQVRGEKLGSLRSGVSCEAGTCIGTEQGFQEFNALMSRIEAGVGFG